MLHAFQSPSSPFHIAASNNNELDHTQSFDVARAVRKSVDFYNSFAKELCVNALFLTVKEKPDWARLLLERRNVVDAVVEKVGSNAFTKRRPLDAEPYKAYVKKQHDAQQPLLFRLGYGPLKNRQAGPKDQLPDLAEYIATIQTARVLHAVACLYPFGVHLQIIPDDTRTTVANLCETAETESYIAGLQDMIRRLGFDSWMRVENGQKRIYEQYRVNDYIKQAEEKLLSWKESDKEGFMLKWQKACENAKKNILSTSPQQEQIEAEQAAWRYWISTHAEILSGIWSVEEAFCIRYSHHPQLFQLFSLVGSGKTKLPWQVVIPFESVTEQVFPDDLRLAA